MIVGKGIDDRRDDEHELGLRGVDGVRGLYFPYQRVSDDAKCTLKYLARSFGSCQILENFGSSRRTRDFVVDPAAAVHEDFSFGLRAFTEMSFLNNIRN